LKNFEEKPLDPFDLLPLDRAGRIPYEEHRKGGDRTRLGENLLLLGQPGEPGDKGLESGEGEGGFLPAGGGFLPFRGPNPEGSDNPLPPIPHNPSPCIVVEFTESKEESKGKTFFSGWDPLPMTGGISQNPGSPFENRTRGTTKGGKELEGDLSHCDRITVEIEPLDPLYNIVPYNPIGGKARNPCFEIEEVSSHKFLKGKKIGGAVEYWKRRDPDRAQEDLPLGVVEAEPFLLQDPRKLPWHDPLVPELCMDQEGEPLRGGGVGWGGMTALIERREKKSQDKKKERTLKAPHPL
jgi:hypothetical protein